MVDCLIKQLKIVIQILIIIIIYTEQTIHGTCIILGVIINQIIFLSCNYLLKIIIVAITLDIQQYTSNKVG